MHAINGEDYTIEGNLGLPDLALGAIEDDMVLGGHPHNL